MTDKATKRPWKVSRNHTFRNDIVDAKNNTIVFLPHEALSKANAELIVRAVNSHDAMVDALDYVIRYHREHDSGEGELFGLDYVTTCIATLNLAKGV